MEIPNSREFIRSVLAAHRNLVDDAWAQWLVLSDKERDLFDNGFKSYLTQFIDSLIEAE